MRVSDSHSCVGWLGGEIKQYHAEVINRVHNKHPIDKASDRLIMHDIVSQK